MHILKGPISTTALKDDAPGLASLACDPLALDLNQVLGKGVSMWAVQGVEGVPSIASIDRPRVGAGSVLIEVAAAGVNRADLLQVAGVVVEVGSRVD